AEVDLVKLNWDSVYWLPNSMAKYFEHNALYGGGSVSYVGAFCADETTDVLEERFRSRQGHLWEDRHRRGDRKIAEFSDHTVTMLLRIACLPYAPAAESMDMAKIHIVEIPLVEEVLLKVYHASRFGGEDELNLNRTDYRHNDYHQW